MKLVVYDQERDELWLHPVLINIIKVIGWLFLGFVVMPIYVLYLLVTDKK